VLLASDLIEHDGGDLRDLPLIDRKRRLAELIAVTRDGQTPFPKTGVWRRNPLSVRERTNLRHSRMRPPLLMKA
jgi:ATP-dependent DNA ligase